MARKQSSAVRKADQGWHGIKRIHAKEFFPPEKSLSDFYSEHLKTVKTLEVEIGSGSGSFLLPAAKKKPDHFFLGIEYSPRFLKLLRDRAEDLNLKNIMLLCCDAKLFLRHGLPDESVDVLHVYFPDPWPKNRQRRKRFMGQEGLAEILRVLKPKGRLYFSTDHVAYAKSTKKLLSAHQQLKIIDAEEIFPTSEDIRDLSYVAYGGRTHFGDKFLARGKSVHFFEVEKIN